VACAMMDCLPMDATSYQTCPVLLRDTMQVRADMHMSDVTICCERLAALACWAAY